MTVLKLTSVGTSTGMVLPGEMLAHLKVQNGDQICAVQTPDGYLLTPFDPALEEQLKTGRKFMVDYRETLKALAQ